MANIYSIIEKEVQKGNKLIDKKGNFIAPEKVEVMAKKSYITDLKNGVIPFEKSFEDYHRDIIEAGFIPVEHLIKNVLNGFFGVGEVPAMPDPAENDEVMPENIAN